ILMHDDRPPWDETREELRRHPVACRPVLRNVDEKYLDRTAAPLKVPYVAFMDLDEIGVISNVAIEEPAKAVSSLYRRMKKCAEGPLFDLKAIVRMNELLPGTPGPL